MCWYQPNLAYCTCTFFQLIQPCLNAKYYPPPDPSRNPKPLIVTCDVKNFAKGVGIRNCALCLGRYRAASSVSTAMPIPMGMGPSMGAGVGMGMGMGVYPNLDIVGGGGGFLEMLWGDMGEIETLTHAQASAPEPAPEQAPAQNYVQVQAQPEPKPETKSGSRSPDGISVSMSAARSVSSSGVRRTETESRLRRASPYDRPMRRADSPSLLDDDTARSAMLRAQVEQVRMELEFEMAMQMVGVDRVDDGENEGEMGLRLMSPGDDSVVEKKEEEVETSSGAGMESGAKDDGVGGVRKGEKTEEEGEEKTIQVNIKLKNEEEAHVDGNGMVESECAFS